MIVTEINVIQPVYFYEFVLIIITDTVLYDEMFQFIMVMNGHLNNNDLIGGFIIL